MAKSAIKLKFCCFEMKSLEDYYSLTHMHKEE